MTTPVPTMSDERDAYADALLDLHDRCEADGLAFAAEMTILVAAWMHARRALGRTGEIFVEPPAPDAGERSPAHALFVVARNTPAGRLAPAPGDRGDEPRRAHPDQDAHADPDRVVMRGPRPCEDRCRRRPPRYGPGLTVLYDLLRDGGPPIVLTPPQSTTVGSLRTRCSTASRLCASHQLILREEPDRVTITRQPRKARR